MLEAFMIMEVRPWIRGLEGAVSWGWVEALAVCCWLPEGERTGPRDLFGSFNSKFYNPNEFRKKVWKCPLYQVVERAVKKVQQLLPFLPVSLLLQTFGRKTKE